MKYRIKILLILILITNLSFGQNDKSNEKVTEPLSKEELIVIFEEYQMASSSVFKAGSKVADVDALYSFYTADFEYNHPKYGGIYSRELLYNNTVKYLSKGGYDTMKPKITLKRIVGLEAIVVEQHYEGKTETTMTLFKFRKNKICYIEEYW